MTTTRHHIRRIKDLDRLQKWMCRAIRTPESRFDAIGQHAGFYLAGDGGHPAADRLKIYIRDYWARCVDCLLQDFRGLECVLGPKSFQGWMQRYLVRYPSRSYTLRNLGKNLLEFMRASYRGRRREMIIDMIRFEWAKIEAFDRPAVPAFDPRLLTETQKRRLDQIPIRLQPHLFLLRLRYPVYQVLDKKRRQLPVREECFTVVYRNEDRVYHKEIDPIFYAILMDMRNGRTLSKACGRVQRRLREKDIRRLQSEVSAWFQNAVANRWLCGMKGAKSSERVRPSLQFGDEFSLQNRLVTASSHPRGHRLSLLRGRKRKTAQHS